MKLAVNGKTFAVVERGGVARVALQIVRAIARHRPDVEIDVLVPVAAPHGPLPEVPANVRYRSTTSRFHATGYGRSLWEQLALPGAVRRGGYDCLLNLSNSAPVWRDPGVPQLLLVHDAGFLNREWYSAPYSRYVEAVVRRAARRGVRLVTVSGASARDLRDAFPEAGSWEVVYNDADRPPASIPELEFAGPFVLFLGSLNPRKNLEGAVAGFRIFNEKSKLEYRLVIVGAEKAIFRDVPGLSSGSPGHEDEGIHVAGYVTDPERWAYVRAARALLLPSHLEGFALPVLEALRAGTPVVASDLPVIRELYGDAVERVDPGSPEDIAAGLTRICTDEELRRERVAAGADVSERYSWERSAERYLEVLAKTVSPR